MSNLCARDFRRILIIKPSSFGDVIHAMPVLHGLRSRFPKARISWLVANSCAGLLEGHPDLDEVIRFDRKRYGRIGRNLGPTIEFVRFLGALRSRRFDLVLDLQGLFRSGFMTLATGACERLGFANAREFAPLFYTRRIAVKDMDMHAVDRNYLFARTLGFGDLPVAFNMPVRAEAARAVVEVLAGHGIAPGQPYAVMGPGTRWETKRWPAAGFAEIARRIRSEFGLPVAPTMGRRSEFDALAARPRRGVRGDLSETPRSSRPPPRSWSADVRLHGGGARRSRPRHPCRRPFSLCQPPVDATDRIQSDGNRDALRNPARVGRDPGDGVRCRR